MKKALLYIGIVLLAFGCRQAENDPELLSKGTMPVSISLPVEDSYNPYQVAGRRSIGDPGTTERFAFPRHIYFFVLKYNGATWSIWHKEHLEPLEEDWTPKHYFGRLQSIGDSIFEYNEQINLLLAAEKFAGEVFAIASPNELVFNTPFASIETADQVRNLQFSTADPDTKANLHNIYSTPYNYELSGSYYGAFSSIYQRVPHIDLMLYHVAAKVDITWYVDENNRINKDNPASAVRLTSLKACNLFNGYAYCFKPMKNVVGSAPLATGDTIEIVKRTDEGLWWEGRSYFYTIPYTTTAVGKENYFPLQMQMETNASGNYYRPTLYLEIDPTATFVPWLRADFNLNQPLSAGTDTKVVAKDS